MKSDFRNRTHQKKALRGKEEDEEIFRLFHALCDLAARYFYIISILFSIVFLKYFFSISIQFLLRRRGGGREF